MITFKQLEALYWIAELGSFESAAEKLNMSQSAVSKRISELEQTFGIHVFDRTKRSARLTEQGTKLLQRASSLLEQRDSLLDEISSKAVVNARVRIGVTELVGMTWLPEWIQQVHRSYPLIQLEPTVDTSFELFRKLVADEIDIAVLPEAYNITGYTSITLGEVGSQWMCSSSLTDEEFELTVDKLKNHTLIAQSSTSAAGTIYEKWLLDKGASFGKILRVNNLLGQVSLAVAGLGIAYLPSSSLQHLVARGDLRVISSQLTPPNIVYAAIYRADRRSKIYRDVCTTAMKCFDCTKLIV